MTPIAKDYAPRELDHYDHYVRIMHQQYIHEKRTAQALAFAIWKIAKGEWSADDIVDVDEFDLSGFSLADYAP